MGSNQDNIITVAKQDNIITMADQNNIITMADQNNIITMADQNNIITMADQNNIIATAFSEKMAARRAREAIEAALHALAEAHGELDLRTRARAIARMGDQVLPVLLTMLGTTDPQIRGGLGQVAASLHAAGIPVIEMRLEDLDALPGDHRATHPPDELLALPAEHHAGDDLHPTASQLESATHRGVLGPLGPPRLPPSSSRRGPRGLSPRAA